MLAFLIANLVDISVFWFLKRLTGSKMLWLRATGSTAVSQLIDTIVISWIIWYGPYSPSVSFATYVTIVMTSYLLKLTAAIVVTPIIYALHALFERKFKLAPLGTPDQSSGA
jgi:uncharacterized integral membrane protein (TIGR00697 family)